MPLATTQINRAKVLLAADDKNPFNRNEARRLARAMNLYYLSPVFLCSGGVSLKHELEGKYGFQEDFTFCDLLLNFFNVPFTDEAILFSGYIIAVTFMCLIWLPAWKKSAYNHGFNNTHGLDSDDYSIALDLAWSGGHNHACYAYNWEVDCSQEFASDCPLADGCYILNMTDGLAYCTLDPNTIPSSPEPDITWMAAVQNAVNQGKILYVDPASFVNDTFTSYYLTGDYDGGYWRIAVCNRTREAIYQTHQAKIKWIWSFIGIIVGSIVFLIIINELLRCFHSFSDVVNPGNYRFIRIEQHEETTPIVQPAPTYV